jgi:hypothetical protein
MQKDKTAGLVAILKHNETVQPDSELLNILKSTVPQFFGNGFIYSDWGG